MLNTQSPLPLYHQLADILMQQIRSGIFKPGDTVPSETSLAKDYKIGRPTVRQAMDVLVKKGLVERKRGSGTYVKEKPRSIDLFSLAGTSQAFLTRGIEIGTEIVEKTSMIRVKNDPANPFNQAEAFYLSRVTKDNAGPIVLEDIFLHAQLFSGIDNIDMQNRSLSQLVLDQYHLKPQTGRQSFKIRSLSGSKAVLLEIKNNSPVLEVSRTLDFPDAPEAVFSRLFCLTDRFAFSQTIGLQA